MCYISNIKTTEADKMIINMDGIAETVAAKIVMEVESRTEDFAETFDVGQLIEQKLEDVLDDMPGISFENIYPIIENHREVELAVSACKVFIEDWRGEQKEWGDGSMASKMRYHGVKQSDFV
jgi:hypothetical protein